jgi:serine/threonine protein phosphatase PrpC
MMWIGGLFVLLSLAWVIAHTSGYGAEARVSQRPPEHPSKRPSQNPSKHLSMEPPSGGPSLFGTNLEAIPSLINEEDDLELTIVTASPSADMPASSAPSKSAASSSALRADTPSIKVIYEDEAELEEVTLPHARILISANAGSDTGRHRPRNEDSLLVLPERSLFVVADGMGGYEGGEVASSLAVETIRRAFEKNIFEGNTAADSSIPRRGREMACAIQMANQAVLRRSKDETALRNMGTTVIAARFSPNKQRVYIGHVGDSRCYRLRGTTLRQLTTDHTLRELGMKGPSSKQLFQAVGIRPTITIDLVVDKPRPQDIYLLCSDGLSKMVSDDQVRDVLRAEPDLEAAVLSLIEKANEQGGRDNVTVILVKIIERGAAEQIAALSAGNS